MPLEEEFSGSLNKQLEYDSTNFTVTSSNFVPWDSNYTLDKLFDGNSNTYMHTQKNVVVSETKPVDLVIDLKETKSFNKITFVGKGNNNKQLPTKVTISGSNDNTNFTLIGSDDELTSSGGKAYFGIPNIVSYRYVKVEVTGAQNSKVAKDVGKAVINSPLVTTAVFGNDPNVGRLVSCVGDFMGNNGLPFDKNQMSIWLGKELVFDRGSFCIDRRKEEKLSKYMKERSFDSEHKTYPEHNMTVDIFYRLSGKGKGSAVVKGTDLSYAYVRENADYRS